MWLEYGIVRLLCAQHSVERVFVHDPFGERICLEDAGSYPRLEYEPSA